MDILGLELRYSDQYKAACVWIDDNRQHLITANELIAFAEENNAKCEESPGEWAYVIYFSHRWPELYTESALRRCKNLKG